MRLLSGISRFILSTIPCFNRAAGISFLMILVGCDTMADKLANVGRTPDFNEVSTYQDRISAEITRSKMERGLVASEDEKPRKTPNSLWQPGARTFFRDQRARAVGDILKVVVTIQDSVKLNNKTERKRTNNSKMGLPNLFGLESSYGKVLNDAVDPSNLIGINASDNAKGEGKIDRTDTIKTTVAATVVKILPSNNLVIKGSQEIRVNFELREVTVEGIVRPEDISSENSVTLDQIAEARVSYGGRGNISDLQQDKYGKQILDIVNPF